MNWFKENPFLAGLGIVTIIICGVLAFFVSQAYTQYQGTVDAYGQAVQKLHTLQNRSPFPNKENFDKLQALEQQYKTELDNLRGKLVKMEIPLKPDIKPQQFQDELRVAVDEVVHVTDSVTFPLPDLSLFKPTPPGEHLRRGRVERVPEGDPCTGRQVVQRLVVEVDEPALRGHFHFRGLGNAERFFDGAHYPLCQWGG